MKIAEVAMTAEPCLPPEVLTPRSVRLTALTPGYCHACGTWDLHARTCSCCGVDFDAQASDEDDR